MFPMTLRLQKKHYIKDSGVVEDLVSGGYRQDTPVSVAQRATWPDEKIVRGSLGDIAEKVERH